MILQWLGINFLLCWFFLYILNNENNKINKIYETNEFYEHLNTLNRYFYFISNIYILCYIFYIICHIKIKTDVITNANINYFAISLFLILLI